MIYEFLHLLHPSRGVVCRRSAPASDNAYYKYKEHRGGDACHLCVVAQSKEKGACCLGCVWAEEVSLSLAAVSRLSIHNTCCDSFMRGGAIYGDRHIYAPSFFAAPRQKRSCAHQIWVRTCAVRTIYGFAWRVRGHTWRDTAEI